MPFRTGMYSTFPHPSRTTFTLPVNRLFFVPFPIATERAIDRIAFEVTTGGTAGSVGRLGIYADDDGNPGALLLDAGTVDTTSTGAKEIAVAETLDAGLSWLAIVAQVAGFGVRGAASPYMSVPAASVTSSIIPLTHLYKDASSGALPASASGLTTATSTSPVLFLRAA